MGLLRPDEKRDWTNLKAVFLHNTLQGSSQTHVTPNYLDELIKNNLQFAKYNWQKNARQRPKLEVEYSLCHILTLWLIIFHIFFYFRGAID